MPPAPVPQSINRCRMVEQRANRRLAAIMSADVVGYTRLKQVDEVGTLVWSGIVPRRRSPRCIVTPCQ